MTERKFFIGPELFTTDGFGPSPVSSFIRNLVDKTLERAAHEGILYPHYDMQFKTQENGDVEVMVVCTDFVPVRVTGFNLNSAMVIDPDAVIASTKKEEGH